MPKYDFDAQRLCVSAPFAAGAEIPLDKQQSNYLLNVLRLQDGANILIFNGQDGEWQASLRLASRKSAVLIPEWLVRAQTQPFDLHYLFAPLKHARLDYMVQKAVEMGASRLVPVLTRRTQVSRINLERMRANAVEAVEQCGILNIPDCDEPVALERLLAKWPAERRLIFCDEGEDVSDPVTLLRSKIGEAPAPLAVLIGPEGGFDEGERRLIRSIPQAIAISLGPRILRADTAAVAALAVVQSAVGDWRHQL
jgi:16S rRNA (uracil1498-N3)-methyltransferase